MADFMIHCAGKLNQASSPIWIASRSGAQRFIVEFESLCKVPLILLPFIADAQDTR